jgi:hypothetical protein
MFLGARYLQMVTHQRTITHREIVQEKDSKITVGIMPKGGFVLELKPQ